MITSSKQNSTVGSQVKVGFLTLVVRAVIATSGDGLPDVYFLSNLADTRFYEFTPHSGLRAASRSKKLLSAPPSCAPPWSALRRPKRRAPSRPRRPRLG